MIEAQEILIQLNISDYPNMKSDSRGKFHRSISDKAYFQQDVKITTTTEAFNILSRL